MAPETRLAGFGRDAGPRKGLPGAVFGGVRGGVAPLRACKMPKIALFACFTVVQPVDNSVHNLSVACENSSFSSF